MNKSYTEKIIELTNLLQYTFGEGIRIINSINSNITWIISKSLFHKKDEICEMINQFMSENNIPYAVLN